MNEITTPFTHTGLPAPVAAEVEAATTRIKDRPSFNLLTKISATSRAIAIAAVSMRDNVTVFPLKPWESKS